MQPTIGFIGIGVMGAPMAGHLLDAGYALAVHTRTPAKAEDLLQRGAHWCDNPAEVAGNSEFILTMLGYPDDVESTYFGQSGIFTTATEGTVLIDLTTSDPRLAEKIAKTAKSRKMQALDAPVSGGDRGAREGILSIMVGGDESAFERSLPILQTFGQNIIHQGPSGSGQHTKMANQIAIASGMLGTCEAVHYAERSGLDPAAVLRSISTGAAGSWTLSNLAPRMLQEDYAPGFYVKHFIKDLKIALESAERMHLNLPGLKLAKQLYENLAEMGAESQGTQALIRWYRHGE